MMVEVVSLRMVRERSVPAPRVISRPSDVAKLWHMLHPDEPDREELWLVCLDASMQPTKISMVSRGDLDGALVTPREVFKTAILANARCIIVVHNHPSGSVGPSEEDRWITDVLWHAGEILGIPLCDHVIVANGRYYSVASLEGWEGLMYAVPRDRQTRHDPGPETHASEGDWRAGQI